MGIACHPKNKIPVRFPIRRFGYVRIFVNF